jgi:hypothetical protein
MKPPLKEKGLIGHILRHKNLLKPIVEREIVVRPIKEFY